MIDRGNGERNNRLPKAAALATVAALAFGACSSSPEEKQGTAVGAVLDKGGEDLTNPTDAYNYSEEDKRALEGLMDIDINDLAKELGVTLEEVSEYYKDYKSTPNALASNEPAVDGDSNLEYIDRAAAIIYSLISADPEETKRVMAGLGWGPKELEVIMKQTRLVSGLRFEYDDSNGWVKAYPDKEDEFTTKALRDFVVPEGFRGSIPINTKSKKYKELFPEGYLYSFPEWQRYCQGFALATAAAIKRISYDIAPSQPYDGTDLYRQNYSSDMVVTGGKNNKTPVDPADTRPIWVGSNGGIVFDVLPPYDKTPNNNVYYETGAVDGGVTVPYPYSPIGIAQFQIQ